jgi:hypothetical protein
MVTPSLTLALSPPIAMLQHVQAPPITILQGIPPVVGGTVATHHVASALCTLPQHQPGPTRIVAPSVHTPPFNINPTVNVALFPMVVS